MSQLYTWCAVALVMLMSTAGDVLLSRAMKQVGHVGQVWRSRGLFVVIDRTLGNPNFLLGVAAMATAFYSLLFGLSWGDMSLVVPASASLTFAASTVAAKLFLHERVDGRRWVAAVLVAVGVVLLAG